MFRRGEKGFTLIELLVVVAILGVLAAIAIPSVASFIGRGEFEAALTERDNVMVAVTAAMADVAIDEHVNPLIPGHIAAPDINTVGYTDSSNATASLPIENYIVGGLASLAYEYDVLDDGLVLATTGPIS